LKGKIQGDPAAGPESVTQVGAQGEQIGEPLGEQVQLWPQAVVQVVPELQVSPCPETPEPEPEPEVKPPGHDDGQVPYLEEMVEYYYDLDIITINIFAITCQRH